MRPIKFRGRALSDGRLVYGYYRFISESNTHQIIWGEQLQAGADIDPDTLGQLTGLLDKNGKGIYEGDIVLFERNRDGFAELQWRKEIKFETDMYNAKFDFPCFDSCEVIGNIYENPDLLSK